MLIQKQQVFILQYILHYAYHILYIRCGLYGAVQVAHHTALSLAKHTRNLESLDLSWCRDMTDEALGLIVDSCLSLKLLKLFGCTQVRMLLSCSLNSARNWSNIYDNVIDSWHLDLVCSHLLFYLF